jgi:hypothetical protein
MSALPIPIESARRMSVDAFRREFEEINATYEREKNATARRDQGLAGLFYRSGWTQEELAKVLGKARRYVAYRLTFGRFLAFGTDVPNIESAISKLTEGGFRNYWSRTDSSHNERQRFAAVMRELSESTLAAKPRKGLAREIISAFGDGKWHELETIANHVGEPADSLTHIIANMACCNKAVALCEKKQRGKVTLVRVVKATRSIDLAALMQDLGPILDGLKAEGKKNVATISPGTVAHLVHQLEQLLEKLAK